MIKQFAQYLIESEQKYEFKVKIAQLEMDNELLDRIEHALKGFDLGSISKPKHVPFVDKCIDFPSLGTCDMNVFDVCLKCPATDEQVRVALGTQGRIPLANIVVIPKNSPEELRRECEEDEPINKEAILTKPLENISGGQELVGMKKVESMLKELETRRMEFAAKDIPQKAETTNALPQNSKNVVAKKSHNVKGR